MLSFFLSLSLSNICGIIAEYGREKHEPVCGEDILKLVCGVDVSGAAEAQDGSVFAVQNQGTVHNVEK